MSEELREKLHELIIDEKALTADLIDRVKKFIRLTREGKVIFMISKDRLSIKDQILLYLVGKRFAKKLKIVDDGSIKLGDITPITGLRGDDLMRGLSANPYIVYVSNGRYRLNTLYLSEILDNLEKILVETPP